MPVGVSYVSNIGLLGSPFRWIITLLLLILKTHFCLVAVVVVVDPLDNLKFTCVGKLLALQSFEQIEQERMLLINIYILLIQS